MSHLSSPHAALAKKGINILQVVVDSATGYLYVVFEYCWEDPKQEHKLHWSKSVVAVTNMADIFSTLLGRVDMARELLEQE